MLITHPKKEIANRDFKEILLRNSYLRVSTVVLRLKVENLE
ncbi:unnamed protein product [Brassica oleracea]